MAQTFVVRRSDGMYLRRHRREGTWRSWTRKPGLAHSFHVLDDAHAVAFIISPGLPGTTLEVVPAN